MTEPKEKPVLLVPALRKYVPDYFIAIAYEADVSLVFSVLDAALHSPESTVCAVIDPRAVLFLQDACDVGDLMKVAAELIDIARSQELPIFELPPIGYHTESQLRNYFISWAKHYLPSPTTSQGPPTSPTPPPKPDNHFEDTAIEMLAEIAGKLDALTSIAKAASGAFEDIADSVQQLRLKNIIVKQPDLASSRTILFIPCPFEAVPEDFFNIADAAGIRIETAPEIGGVRRPMDQFAGVIDPRNLLADAVGEGIVRGGEIEVAYAKEQVQWTRTDYPEKTYLSIPPSTRKYGWTKSWVHRLAHRKQHLKT